MDQLLSCAYIILILIGCSGAEKRESQPDTKKIDIQSALFKQGTSLPAESWICLEFNFNRLCHPMDWKIRDTSAHRIVFNLGPQHDTDEYLTVLQYPITDSQTIETYLREIGGQISYDSTDRVRQYDLSKINFENGETCYFAEYEVNINDRKYATYAMYFEHKNCVFDMTLQSRFLDEAYEIFQNILYNFSVSNEALFSSLEGISSYENVRFNTL